MYIIGSQRYKPRLLFYFMRSYAPVSVPRPGYSLSWKRRPNPQSRPAQSAGRLGGGGISSGYGDGAGGFADVGRALLPIHLHLPDLPCPTTLPVVSLSQLVPTYRTYINEMAI